MPALHASLGPATIMTGDGDLLRFKPKGPIQHHGAKPNPTTPRKGLRTISARFFVDFNVEGKRWKMDDLVKVVTDHRNGAASFIAQMGVWAPKEGPREVEDSAQILIFNDAELGLEAFKEEMVVLGETIAREMKQYEVYLDIQERGVLVDGYVVTP